MSAFFILLALQQNPKLTLGVAEGPGPALVCEGETELPDGTVLNVELFFGTRGEPLLHQFVRVKEGAYKAPFLLFKGREKNLPGLYRAKAHYHQAFQPRPNQDIGNFTVEGSAKIGTSAEIEAAHQAVRERFVAELKVYKALADEIHDAFQAAGGKPKPEEWKKKVEGWRRACMGVEDRAAADPDYKVLGFGRVLSSGLEYLREKVRALVEFGGAERGPDLLLGREQLDGMIRSIILEIAPEGSTTAQRRDLVGQARGALQAALEAQGPALAAARRAFTEAVFRLNLKASGVAVDILRQLIEEGNAYLDAAENDREAARKLHPTLDKKLDALLRELTKE